MDKNSAIGLTLIAVLLLGYFYFFSPAPQPVTPEQATTTSPVQPAPETVPQTVLPTDSAEVASFGDLSSALSGKESPLIIDTEDLRITFSSKGGVIKELELKKYKTYDQEPLKLITPTTNSFRLNSQYQGKEIDLYGLYYDADQRKTGDTTVVTYALTLANGSKVSQTYKIPASGYEIGYALNSRGFDQLLSGDNLSFQWTNILTPVEKDLTDTREHSTIAYYTEADGFDELDQRSKDQESEVFGTPIEWVAIKEKFFLSAIIAKPGFAGGEIETSMNESDSSVVKRANVKLFIPKNELANGKATFKFYFGPNDYKKIGAVATDFSKNVYLGWPPVYWVNKFVIFPVFYFLTSWLSSLSWFYSHSHTSHTSVWQK
jgi:YidC/Oxa1 family membrane protein insertase